MQGPLNLEIMARVTSKRKIGASSGLSPNIAQGCVYSSGFSGYKIRAADVDEEGRLLVRSDRLRPTMTVDPMVLIAGREPRLDRAN